MRRSGPPTRRTPLRASPASLARSAPIAQTKAPRAGRRPQSAAPAKSRRSGLKPVAAEVAAEVRRRSGGRCEIGLPGCAREGQHLHHRAGRGPGRERPDLVAHLCHACHGEVHAAPARAYENGWMIRRTGPVPSVEDAPRLRPATAVGSSDADEARP